jgi:hypothetical protein
MNMHLAEIALHVVPGAHAVVLMDQAGWHLTPKLWLSANISVIAIPSKSPELNLWENPGSSCATTGCRTERSAPTTRLSTTAGTPETSP